MLLSTYFDPIDSDLLSSFDHPNLLGHNMMIHTADFTPDLKKAKVCIVGLPISNQTEFNNAEEKPVAQIPATNIRRALYRLYKSQSMQNIADLGDLKPGPTQDQTEERISFVTQVLHEAGCLAIFIGQNQAHTLQQIEGLQRQFDESKKPKKLSLTVIDQKLDMDYLPQFGQGDNFLNSIFISSRPSVFDFTLLAYQTYLNDPGHLSFVEQAGFTLRRLGAHRDHPIGTEPYIRQADVLSFDIAAITAKDCPASNNVQPFGLSAEEWCQLCWYAGNSPKVKSIGIYGYMPELDINLRSAQLLAVGIWHILEGISLNRNPEDILVYKIAIPGMEEVQFITEKADNRWWVTFYNKPISSLNQDLLLFACQEQDYKDVLKGEMPQLLVRILNRMAIYEKQVNQLKSDGHPETAR
jgi:arginase family enzyme